MHKPPLLTNRCGNIIIIKTKRKGGDNMLKRFITSALAVTLLFGSAAVLPEMSVTNDTVIAASAADTTLAKVSGVKASSVGYKTASLTWEKVKGAKGYRIYVYDTAAKKYSKVTTISKNITTYKLTGLKQGKTYKYKVRAYKKVKGKTVWGKCSDAVSLSTKKKIDCDSYGWVYEVPSEDKDKYESLEKMTVVTNAKERDALIKYIKQNYPKGDVRDSKLSFATLLKSVKDDVFEDKVLIYTLSVTEGIDPKYTQVCESNMYLQKKGGKLTAVINTSYKEKVPENVAVNDEYYTRFNCYLAAVNKKDIAKVEVFKTTDKKVQ